jgi:phosphoglycerol geranylgeranyltransferase
MKPGKVDLYINEILGSKGAMLFSLIDPVDYRNTDAAINTAKEAADGGADIILLGGSVGAAGNLLDSVAKGIKDAIDVPLVLFPGNTSTMTKHADAVYFTSLLNSRNPYWHTQAQMLAIPLIRESKIETLPVGYILVYPGGTAGWVGDANLIPREKPNIAAMLALTGEHMGQRFILTDTGSNPHAQGCGAIPSEMIRAVKREISVPYIVGGGITTISEAKRVFSSGADVIQIGTAFQDGKDGSVKKKATAFSKIAKEEGLKKLRTQ